MKMIYKDLNELQINWTELQLVKRRQRNETLREVYLVDERYVLKRYLINKKTLLYPRPWASEAKGLLHAQGLNVPEYIATYAGIGAGGHREFVFQRTMIPGPHLIGLPAIPALEAMADLLAKLHERGIITRDATPRNFLLRADGTVFIIDLGKAQIHHFHPYYGIGSELARFVHGALNYNEELWQCFFRRYYQGRSAGPASKAIEQFLYRLCKQNRIRRRALTP